MVTAKSKKRNIRSVIVIVLLAGITVSTVTAFQLFGSIVKRESVLYIPSGTSLEALTDSLASGGKTTGPVRFRMAAKAVAGSREIRPGRYELKQGMSAVGLVRMIYGGHQSPVKLTFNNIRTMPQLAAYLGDRFMADSTAFAAALTSDSTAASYGFSKEEFIAMFIPDTYELYWTTTPETFVSRMNDSYKLFWSGERTAKLARTGLTQTQAATLASIVDEETNKTDEMPTIAGVYINRLRDGMRLQADPTVKFAVGDFSIKRIMHQHLTTDSPYNTYRYKGLPPGPIRMPSSAALNAVLNYTESDYMYFCARADFSGYHAFAKTYAEHLRNARAYSEALNRAGIK